MVQRILVAVLATVLAALGETGCSSSGNSLPRAASAANPLASAGLPMARVRIKEFSDLPRYSDYYHPSAITNGPDGALWVTDDIDQDFGENVVVRIEPTGKRTNAYYYGGVSTEGASFQDVTSGPDGNLWITDEYNEQILRMSLDGHFKGFPLQGFVAPISITSGPDGALWFTEYGAIGRITTQGKITTYSESGGLQDIAAGPDGALWFTEAQAGKIGRITTHGKVTEYSNGISSGSEPYSIALGPDGALWFTEALGGRIGRITTKGKVTEYSNGITPTEQPDDIAVGADGAMWFTEFEESGSYLINTSKIGRITTAGWISEYSRHLDPTSEPTGIAHGPDGNMWFVEGMADRVGRVRL
ncbi:MAG: SMP-30/gluconolactonase/LRE family protein [Candidatus Baltobacteraceae bacterium]